MPRTICVGDIHGCLEEFDELLRVLEYTRGKDILVLLGDLIDRGPSPRGVVRRAQEVGALAIKGNHEEKALRWLDHARVEREGGKKNPMRPVWPERQAEWESLSEDDLSWLRGLPLELWFPVRFTRWRVVHAGYEAMPIQRPEKMLRCRYLDPVTGEMVGFKESQYGQPDGTVFWTEMWSRPENVAYGHCVHSLSVPRVDKNLMEAECWGLDTGCCFGGRLSALVLETRELVQVQARAAYTRPPLDVPLPP